METVKCPICNGKKFIKVRDMEGYEFYKRCSCLTGKPPKIEQENPFKEKEKEDTHGATDKGV